MDVFSFIIGAAFVICIMVIISFHRRIKELENKSEDKPNEETENTTSYTEAVNKSEDTINNEAKDTAPYAESENKSVATNNSEVKNAESDLDIVLAKAKLIGLRIIKKLIEPFDWRGRYRRRSFIWRFFILFFTWAWIEIYVLEKVYVIRSCMRPRDPFLEEGFIEILQQITTIEEYNVRVFLSMCIWLILLGPCISRRLHDTGRNSIILLVGWFLMIPCNLIIDWGGFENIRRLVDVLAILCTWCVLICCWFDSKENNKWGVSPKYPNGKTKLSPLSNFMLK